MIVGALLAWGRQDPFISSGEAEVARSAMGRAGALDADRPLVVIVDDADTSATFLGSRAANILRAAADSQRATDVHVFVGTVPDYFAGRPTTRGDPEYDALSRLTLAHIPRTPEPVVLVLTPFYRGHDIAVESGLLEQEPGLWASETLPQVVATPGVERLGFGPSSGPAIALAAAGILGVLTFLGFAYARTVFDDLVTILATAPAFGTAGLTLAAVALDAAGLRLDALGVALAATVLTAFGGVALLVVQRQRDHQPAS
jgi:hypothetical protein